jgi:hypothetical protein
MKQNTTATNAAPAPTIWDRGLVGNPPRVFDGDKDESTAFLRDFRIYRMLNENVREMKLPYYRVLLALGYIRGSKSKKWVDDWVDKQLTALKSKMTGDMASAATDEQLWDDFVSSFESAFTNTTAKYDAMIKLRTLKMEERDLDTYIGMFEHLASKAGFGLNSIGTANMFVEGLPKGLKVAILGRVDDIPRTYAEWVTTAQRVHQQRARKRAELAQQGRKQSVVALASPRSGTDTSGTCTPDSMDDDDRMGAALTEEQKMRYRDEGRCFRCGTRGHVSRTCPEK